MLTADEAKDRALKFNSRHEHEQLNDIFESIINDSRYGHFYTEGCIIKKDFDYIKHFLMGLGYTVEIGKQHDWVENKMAVLEEDDAFEIIISWG